MNLILENPEAVQFEGGVLDAKTSEGITFAVEEDGGYIWGETLQDLKGEEIVVTPDKLVFIATGVYENVYGLNTKEVPNIKVNLSAKSITRLSNKYDFSPYQDLSPLDQAEQERLANSIKNNYESIFFAYGRYFEEENIMSLWCPMDKFSKSFKELKRLIRDSETNIDQSSLLIEFADDYGSFYKWRDLYSPKVKNPKPQVADELDRDGVEMMEFEESFDGFVAQLLNENERMVLPRKEEEEEKIVEEPSDRLSILKNHFNTIVRD